MARSTHKTDLVCLNFGNEKTSYFVIFHDYYPNCASEIETLPISYPSEMLAQPVKQKARFKIKDAKCHLRPRNKEKPRDMGKQGLQGEKL